MKTFYNSVLRLIAFLLLFSSFSAKAQVGIGTSNPNSAAILDLSSDSKGFLPPRLTTAQRNAISTPINGLIVYDTDSNYFFYYNSSWKGLKNTNGLVNYWKLSGVTLSPVSSAHMVSADSFSIGANRVLSMKGGTSNIFIGSQAGLGNTGTQNSFAGYQSGYRSGGSQNTGLGYQSLFSNTSGADNVSVGNTALSSNTSGSNNIAIGSKALLNNTTGVRNIGIGVYAGNTNATSSDNIAIGDSALYSNTIGEGNIAIGSRALRLTTNTYHNTAVGYRAGETSTGRGNSYFGNYAGNAGTTGIFNTFVGDSAGYSNTNGNRNTYVGFNTNGNVGANNQTAIGNGASAFGINTMSFGNQNVVNWAFARNSLSAGVFQVGTTSSNGNGAYLTAGGTWTNASDINLKENLNRLNSADVLGKINELDITRWMYKGTDNEYHIGPMAQQFTSLFNVGVNNTSISTIDPAGVALVGVQELSKQNETLKKENLEMKSKLDALNNAILELKAKVDVLSVSAGEKH